MRVRYRPVFLYGRKTPNTFRVLPIRESRNGAELSGKGLLAHRDSINDTAKRNEKILKAAFKEYKRARKSGFQGRLIVPLNSFALANAEGGARIVGAFKMLDGELRKNVIIEVFQLPRALSVGLLDEITIPLLAFFEHYVAGPEPDMVDFTLFTNLNYLGVVLDLGMENGGGDMKDRVTKFWAEATKQKLKFFISGVKDRDILDLARRYEAFAIDGPVLGNDLAALAK
jgi:hypothetical protein